MPGTTKCANDKFNNNNKIAQEESFIESAAERFGTKEQHSTSGRQKISQLPQELRLPS